MNIPAAALEKRILTDIPLARHIGVRVVEFDGSSLALGAPLAANSNHKGTAFGGSLFSLAVLAGWVTTEVGRQPFVVYGLLRTADAVSPLDAPAVGASLLAFVLVYFAVFGIGIWYMLRLMHKPPQAGEPEPDPTDPIRTAGIVPGPAQLVDDGEPGR